MIDADDERILHALRRDGRITNQALADAVGLSPSTCLRRVAAMEKRGIIAGYRAVLGPEARDIGFMAYVMIGLSRHTSAVQLAFERRCASAPQVVECHNITGTVEYILRVECRDLPAYRQFHRDVLGDFEHLATITTHVVVGTSKDERA
ncbi:MAG: Lrp/AsnC family transcriptional regulator [Paracoccus sp. (in: a-proteobacteria)]|nr:Lrp/AsnC family transcriptional regulator [Paracoccus sp. (in: a-proteobacteria)]